MRIGLLSDTHLPDGVIREPWPEVARAFDGVDLILHAGDVGSAGCLDWLERIAPVLAALGNNDLGGDLQRDPRVKPRHVLDVEGLRIGLVHDLEPEDGPVRCLMERYLGQSVDVIVSGHTHRERLEHRDGVLMVNPGSPNLPHLMSTRMGTVGLLSVQPDRVSARIVRLGDGPPPNPGRDLFLAVSRSSAAGPASRA